MHESHHTEGLTDLSVIRAQAEERLRRGWPQQEETLVHIHGKYYRGADQRIHKLYPCSANPLVENPEDKEHIWYLFIHLDEEDRPYTYRAPEPTSDVQLEEETRDG